MPFLGIFGCFSPFPGNSGFLAQMGLVASRGSRRGHGAPPRGVDVKATPGAVLRDRDRGSGEPQMALGPRIGVRDSGRPF